MGVGVYRHVPAALPPGMTRYLLYRRLGGPQGRSGLVRKISFPPGFDSRTVQPVASRYTYYVILTHAHTAYYRISDTLMLTTLSVHSADYDDYDEKCFCTEFEAMQIVGSVIYPFMS
jgi:hypothetical protein